MVNKPDLFRYLTKQNDDWGVNLTTIGYHHAAPGSVYPPAGHPETHAFDWQSGRRGLRRGHHPGREGFITGRKYGQVYQATLVHGNRLSPVRGVIKLEL